MTERLNIRRMMMPERREETAIFDPVSMLNDKDWADLDKRVAEMRQFPGTGPHGRHLVEWSIASEEFGHSGDFLTPEDIESAERELGELVEKAYWQSFAKVLDSEAIAELGVNLKRLGKAFPPFPKNCLDMFAEATHWPALGGR